MYSDLVIFQSCSVGIGRKINIEEGRRKQMGQAGYSDVIEE